MVFKSLNVIDLRALPGGADMNKAVGVAPLLLRSVLDAVAKFLSECCLERVAGSWGDVGQCMSKNDWNQRLFRNP